MVGPPRVEPGDMVTCTLRDGTVLRAIVTAEIASTWPDQAAWSVLADPTNPPLPGGIVIESSNRVE